MCLCCLSPLKIRPIKLFSSSQERYTIHQGFQTHIYQGASFGGKKSLRAAFWTKKGCVGRIWKNLSYIVQNLTLIEHFLSFNDQIFKFSCLKEYRRQAALAPLVGRVFETPVIDCTYHGKTVYPNFEKTVKLQNFTRFSPISFYAL